MAKKTEAYGQILHLLQGLKRDYPSYTLGQHISMSIDDYGDCWGLTDKEFLFALEKYRAELDYNISPDTDVDKIVKDAQDLDINRILDDEEGQDEYD